MLINYSDYSIMRNLEHDCLRGYEIQHKSKSENRNESARDQSAKDKGSRNEKNSNQPSDELKQIRVLIAESEQEILLLFKTYLDSLGIESVTAEDGDKAIETFIQSKNMQKKYDAVVLNTDLKGEKRIGGR